MEKGELDTTDGRGQDDNVVRFPKDWIGPLEDLVPIGSRARAQSSDSDDPPTPAEASDFWGEDAAAVHEAVAAPAPHAREERRRAPVDPRRISRRGLAATGVAAGVAALAVGVLVFAGGTRRPYRPATHDRAPSVTSFAADTLPLRQSGGAAGHAALAAAASDAARADRAAARRLQLVSERAMVRGRKADAVLRSSSHHTSDAGSAAATNDTSAAEAETPSTPSVTTPAQPTTPAPTPASPTTSATGASAGGTSSGGDASSGGGASPGTGSGSTTKPYGYGGLLGAGHAGS